MWHALGESYQMCLIGRGVCRMATRDPPWFRKNTLYSSWKTCRHDQLHLITPKEKLKSTQSMQRWQHEERSYVHTEEVETILYISVSVVWINKSFTQVLLSLLISGVLSWWQTSVCSFWFICFTDQRRTCLAQGWVSNLNSLFLLWLKHQELKSKNWHWKLSQIPTSVHLFFVRIMPD